MTEQEIREFHMRMEQIIQDHGYFIQGVSEDNYAYTIGRRDAGKAELYLDFSHLDGGISGLINSIASLIDAGEIEEGKPFHVDSWETEKTKEKTWFVLAPATAEQVEKMLGANNRANRFNVRIPHLQIVIADEDNKLPDELIVKQADAE